jgi:hypothetical protein
MQTIQSKNIVKFVKVVGKNLDFEADRNIPFILIQTNGPDSNFSHFLSFNRHTDKIHIQDLDNPQISRKFKGFGYEDSEIFNRPICHMLLNVKLIMKTFKHQKEGRIYGSTLCLKLKRPD